MNIDELHMIVKTDEEKISIEIPIDLLIFLQLQREDSIIITDREQMLAAMREKLLGYGGDTNIGATAFDLFLDRFFDDQFENAETWLHSEWEDLEDSAEEEGDD